NLFGVFVHGSTAVGTTIEGNLVSTDPSGTTAVPNETAGIWIFGAPQTVVGGAAAGAGNVGSGNKTDGIDVQGAGAPATAIDGNAIGVAADLTTPLGNDVDGVNLAISTSGAKLGLGAANLIGYNGAVGVHLLSTAGGANTIRGNIVTANGG